MYKIVINQNNIYSMSPPSASWLLWWEAPPTIPIWTLRKSTQPKTGIKYSSELFVTPVEHPPSVCSKLSMLRRLHRLQCWYFNSYNTILYIQGHVTFRENIKETLCFMEIICASAKAFDNGRIRSSSNLN